MNRQLQGIEQIAGTYPFDLRVSVRTLRINRFFWELRRPEKRQAFLEDASKALCDAGLSEQEQALVLSRDWIGLVRHGVNFFVLEKLARVLRVANMEVYADMRGESLEAFLRTRRVPDAR
jgi:Aromatic-ring-opening dioxygenase LigAB, LigA subunit